MNKMEEQRVKSELCLIKNCKDLLVVSGLAGVGLGRSPEKKSSVSSLIELTFHGKNVHLPSMHNIGCGKCYY